MSPSSYVPWIPHATQDGFGLVSYDDVLNLTPKKIAPHVHSTLKIPISPLWHTNNMDVYSGSIFLFPDMNENIKNAWENKRWYTSNNFNIVLNSNASFVLHRYPHVGNQITNAQSGMNPETSSFMGGSFTPDFYNTQLDITLTFFQDDVAGWTPTINVNQGDVDGWSPIMSNSSSSPYSIAASTVPYSSRTIILRWSGVWAQWQVIFDSGGWRPTRMYMAPSSGVGGKYCRITLDPSAVSLWTTTQLFSYINGVYAWGGLNVRKYLYNHGFTVQLNNGNGVDWFGTVVADGKPNSEPAHSSFTKRYDYAGGGMSASATPSASYVDLVATGVIDALYHEAGHYLNAVYFRNKGYNYELFSDPEISVIHRTAIKTSPASVPGGNTIFTPQGGHYYSVSEWIAQAVGTWILQKGINDGSAVGVTSNTYAYQPDVVFGSAANKDAFYARMDTLCPDLV
jgi:hypothetical protein